MAASLGPDWLELAISVSGLAFVCYAYWHFRANRQRLFRGRECDKAAIQAIRDTALRDVNEYCQRYSFQIDRLAKIVVRERQVAVAYGQVWLPHSSGDGASNVQHCVYAIAPHDQRHWMRQQSDVFELACDGRLFSIYWVNVARLIRLSSR